MTSPAIDPITLSTIWNSFQSMGREMRHVIDRTAQNYLIAQLQDMAAGIWDAQARTIAVPEGPTSMFLSQQFSVEYILEQDPDFIFLADTKCCGQDASTVAARPGWDELTAVREGRVIELDDDIASRWGPRIVEFFATITDAITPAEVN